ncbi:unnamed protein product [Protopolystoma xenopodis]|uniref:Uncharacterized protein n=1 Tax=Protopolystoma xenopodis TaxID=117903 RepID=A0A448XSC0_9PLAT|nr:unnamed protein product [Protopolystoma xenopodis]
MQASNSTANGILNLVTDVQLSTECSVEHKTLFSGLSRVEYKVELWADENDLSLGLLGNVNKEGYVRSPRLAGSSASSYFHCNS